MLIYSLDVAKPREALETRFTWGIRFVLAAANYAAGGGICVLERETFSSIARNRIRKFSETAICLETYDEFFRLPSIPRRFFRTCELLYQLSWSTFFFF